MMAKRLAAAEGVASGAESAEGAGGDFEHAKSRTASVTDPRRVERVFMVG
jgi:hypothetical protein